MDTVRVDICYRPLRIAWSIHSSDKEAFRRAVRFSHTMWGGGFNPIVLVDRSEANQIVEVFRADLIIPLGDSPEIKEFIDRFPHLINPFFPHELFIKGSKNDAHAHVLDMHNALAYWQEKPEWKALKDEGIRFLRWDEDDPLADIFLMQYGAYPKKEETGIDYADLLDQAAMAINLNVLKNSPISPEVLDHPSLGYLSKAGLYRHYSVDAVWNQPGFFIGDATNIDDLVCCWNLRAADISVHFIDPTHFARYEYTQPALAERMRANLAHLEGHRANLALWSRAYNPQELPQLFDYKGCTIHHVSEHSWNGGNIRVPMMILGEESSLGVVGKDVAGKPKITFSLKDKPFYSDNWFHTQHLVASISLSGVYGDEHHTFQPPYMPEINEFLARAMIVHYSHLRIEPERIGLVIDAADHDSFLYGLPVASLIEQVFERAGLTCKPSNGGLIARQLISRLGGVDGARVFKIPGVRKLFKKYGPTDAFKRVPALQIIGERETGSQYSFKDHHRLFIEPRPMEAKLTPLMVFDYLVEKGLFRMGYELACPTCSLSSWIPLDALKQSNTCELCGTPFDATRQLINGEFHYRRSGLLGLEKNAQGSIPVALVLQQLTNNLRGLRYGNVYATSYDLQPKAGINLPTCEIDFILIYPYGGTFHSRRTDVIIGECKDAGGTIDQNDIENLRQIADALPQNRFETYIALVKLSPFTPEEIELARCLNGQYQSRVILLTGRELEPYHIYERTNKELGTNFHGVSPSHMAQATQHMYFAHPAALPPAA